MYTEVDCHPSDHDISASSPQLTSSPGTYGSNVVLANSVLYANGRDLALLSHNRHTEKRTWECLLTLNTVGLGKYRQARPNGYLAALGHRSPVMHHA